VTATREIGIWL